MIKPFVSSAFCSSLIFADDVVMLASTGQDLQCVLEWFAAECEEALMRFITPKSEVVVLSWRKVDCSLRVGVVCWTKVEEFKHLVVVFTRRWSAGPTGRLEQRLQSCSPSTGLSW